MFARHYFQNIYDKTKLVIITLFSVYMASVKTINSYLVGKIVDKKRIRHLIFYILLALSAYIVNYFLINI